LNRRLLPLIPAGLSVVQVLPASDRITIVARPTSRESACSTCGTWSGRVHSHYTRTLADLPSQGRVAVIRLEVRRFRCANQTCSRRIFAEPLPEVTRPRARRSGRLADVQRHLGLALGGEAGARLAARLTMPASGDTLLRMIHAAALPAEPAPRVVGIDEWAWRRGLTYGTIICDLERNRVIDLLPDRSAEAVAAWLEQHPSVQVIARDRAGVFAQAIHAGAPTAVEVADRWHLLRNLGDALHAAVGRHRAAVTAAIVPHVLASQGEDGPVPVGTIGPALAALRQERREQRRQRFATIRRLHEEGLPPRRIAAVVGMHQRTVERWLAAGGEPEHRRPPMASMLDRFEPELERRWEAGCRQASTLWQTIREQGFRGSYTTVARWVAIRRGAAASSRHRATATRADGSCLSRRPSRRRCAWLLGREPETMTPEEQVLVARITTTVPALGVAADLARRFAAMVDTRDATDLDAWLAAASASELASFAQGLSRDLGAVRAALTERWSTSPVEGQINRLKTVKRQMYGRAGHALLRLRVLVA
jgi:transposase